MIAVKYLHPKATLDDVGIIPMMLDEDDLDSAREQLDRGYAHGGGWHPFEGFTMLPSGGLQYPDDPVMMPLAEMRLREERVVVYECAWVAIIQPDGRHEIARMD